MTLALGGRWIWRHASGAFENGWGDKPEHEGKPEGASQDVVRSKRYPEAEVRPRYARYEARLRRRPMAGVECCAPGNWRAPNRPPHSPCLPQQLQVRSTRYAGQVHDRNQRQISSHSITIVCGTMAPASLAPRVLLFSGFRCRLPGAIYLPVCLPVWLSVVRHSHTCVHDLSHHSGTRAGALDDAPFHSRFEIRASGSQARTARPAGPGHALMRS